MDYFTLVASLPALPPHFDVQRTPVSRPRLRQLLGQLSERDADIFRQLAGFFRWDRQMTKWTDEDIQKRYDGLMRNNETVIREIINHRMNVRTIVAALRRRRDGLDPPRVVGEMVEPIRRNWSDPAFRLGGRFPWIERFSEHLAKGEAVAADRILLEFTWKTWSRMAARYNFSFEAVLLYVARWEIVDRWTSRDVEIGRQRFEQLTSEALGDYATLEL